MATPKYDALQEKVVQWANRDKEVFGVTATSPDKWKDYIGDFLSYSADEAYRLLRIPPLEFDRTYTIETTDIVGSPNISVLGTNNYAGTGGVSYNRILLPVDFVEMVYIRFAGLSGTANAVTGQLLNSGIVFNERTDERTFFDIYAETYSNYYWMRSGDYMYIKPALPAGSQIAFHYYRQLPALDADYSVVPVNFLFAQYGDGVNYPASFQPFLGNPTATEPGTTLYFINLQPAGGVSLPTAVYASAEDRDAANAIFVTPAGYTKTTTQANFVGKEVGNWMKDQNERVLIWGALMNAGSFLDDEKIEARYSAKFHNDIESLNREEKFRRARGGNVQINFQGRGLI